MVRLQTVHYALARARCCDRVDQWFGAFFGQHVFVGQLQFFLVKTKNMLGFRRMLGFKNMSWFRRRVVITPPPSNL